MGCSASTSRVGTSQYEYQYGNSLKDQPIRWRIPVRPSDAAIRYCREDSLPVHYSEGQLAMRILFDDRVGLCFLKQYCREVNISFEEILDCWWKSRDGESNEEGAMRELAEESSIVLKKGDLRYGGYIYFTVKEPATIMHIHIYDTWVDRGIEPVESDEMLPKWFPVNCLPYDKMWADDIHWMPTLLKSKKFTAR